MRDAGVAQETVDGRYELLQRLTDRGLGECWQARDARFKNRLVMLKFLRPVTGDALPEALQEHINALRALKHPAVLATVGQGLWRGRPYLVQEFFEGRTLGDGIDRSRESGELLPARVLEGLFARVLAAVAAAHGAPQAVFHGALNPGCIALHRLPGADFQLRVFDFGLAAFADPDPLAPPRSASALTILAPELLQGALAPDAATDVFGLGALLREMISLPPELGATMTPTSAHRRRDDLPEAVWDTTGIAMSADAAQRFASVEALGEALQHAWAMPVVPRVVAPPAPPAPPAPARPSGPALLADALGSRPLAQQPGAFLALAPMPVSDPLPTLPRPAAFAAAPAMRAPAPPPLPDAPSLKAQDYASTFVLSDFPAHQNPWDVAFLTSDLASPQTRVSSMDALLHAVTHRAEKPPATAPQAAPAIDGTMVLGDDLDLSKTAVTPEPARPGTSTDFDDQNTFVRVPVDGTMVLTDVGGNVEARSFGDSLRRDLPGPALARAPADASDLDATLAPRAPRAPRAPAPVAAPPRGPLPAAPYAPAPPPPWTPPPAPPPGAAASASPPAPSGDSRRMLLLAVAGFVVLASLMALAFALLTRRRS